jgi:integrase
LSTISTTNLQADILTLSAQVTKNKREHSVPLTQAALSLLTTQSSFRVRAWSKPKKRLDQISGVTNWTLHDTRRTFATTCARLGVPVHIIEALLNHRSGTVSGVAAIYNRHRYLNEMRDALERYEAHLASIGIDL